MCCDCTATAGVNHHVCLWNPYVVSKPNGVRSTKNTYQFCSLYYIRLFQYNTYFVCLMVDVNFFYGVCKSYNSLDSRCLIVDTYSKQPILGLTHEVFISESSFSRMWSSRQVTLLPQRGIFYFPWHKPHRKDQQLSVSNLKNS